MATKKINIRIVYYNQTKEYDSRYQKHRNLYSTRVRDNYTICCVYLCIFDVLFSYKKQIYF